MCLSLHLNCVKKWKRAVDKNITQSFSFAHMPLVRDARTTRFINKAIQLTNDSKMFDKMSTRLNQTRRDCTKVYYKYIVELTNLPHIHTTKYIHTRTHWWRVIDVHSSVDACWAIRLTVSEVVITVYRELIWLYVSEERFAAAADRGSPGSLVFRLFCRNETRYCLRTGTW